jgi:hypothetical protein
MPWILELNYNNEFPGKLKMLPTSKEKSRVIEFLQEQERCTIKYETFVSNWT